MASPRRYVSYTLPPSTPQNTLRLPNLDHSSLSHSVSPALIPSHSRSNFKNHLSTFDDTPRHRLPIAALSLDCDTILENKYAPEGILYTGGRDGMVISWDLNLPMIPASSHTEQDSEEGEQSMMRDKDRWEIMTGWADDIIDDEDENEQGLGVDGDVLGDVIPINRVKSINHDHPKWTLDSDEFVSRSPSQFRQCAYLHSDWVNDLLLAQHGRFVISASADGTVKSWAPHSDGEIRVLGAHEDYVKCLALCSSNLIASGSFDRTIKLWDLTRSSVTQTCAPQPVTTMNAGNENNQSVYAMAALPSSTGRSTTIASASPEKIVRLWDTRSAKCTSSLVGHTDNIRAILGSVDGDYLLTGSADASIKLWSLRTLRCLHTFTHHITSVWSLHSSDPSLEVFWSGDKAGNVARVDVKGCVEVGEGECVRVVGCLDREESQVGGINAIVTTSDDTLLWTATSGSSDIRRWHAPPNRQHRAKVFLADFEQEDGSSDRPKEYDSPLPTPKTHARTLSPASAAYLHQTSAPLPSVPQALDIPSVADLAQTNFRPIRALEDAHLTLYGLPMTSLVRLTSPDEPLYPYPSMSVSVSMRDVQGVGKDAEVSTLYSFASRSNVHVPHIRPPIPSGFRPHPSHHRGSVSRGPQQEGGVASVDLLNGYMSRDIINTAQPLFTYSEDADNAQHTDVNSSIGGHEDQVIRGAYGLVRSVVLNDRLHALTVDICGTVAIWDLVRGVCKGAWNPDEVESLFEDSTTPPTSAENGKKRRKNEKRSPRDVLDTVKERVEGEAVVTSWCHVDTKMGLLNVHMNERCFEAELYADELVVIGERRDDAEEPRLNLGKWALRNLFLGFIREEQKLRSSPMTKRHPLPQDGILPPSLHRGHTSSIDTSLSVSSKSLTNRAVVSSPTMLHATVSSSSTSSQITAETPSPVVTDIKPSSLPESHIPLPLSPITVPPNDATPIAIQIKRPRSSTLDLGPQTPTPNSATGYFAARSRQASEPGGNPAEEFTGWSGTPAPPTPPTPGGGLMGRLKSLSKMGNRKPSEYNAPTLSTPSISTIEKEEEGEPVLPSKTPLQILLESPLSPPPSSTLPIVHLPADTLISITSDSAPSTALSSLSRIPLYVGTVASVGEARDVNALENVMPIWLADFLLHNRAPEVPVIKLSFVLMPWVGKEDGEPLPELLNRQQSKLTASRFLRVKKLALHVQEKLDKVESRRGSAESAQSHHSHSHSHSHSYSHPTKSHTHHRTLSTNDKPSAPRPASPGAPPLPTLPPPPASPTLPSPPSLTPPEHEIPMRPNRYAQRATDKYEILCNDTILPLDMTIAAVKQFVWERGSEELVMHYRLKKS